MPPILPLSVINGQPHPVTIPAYGLPMEQDLKEVVRDNIRHLLDIPDGKSGVSLLIKRGVSNGNAQRVLSGETSFGLDLLVQLASIAGVEPWQLCVSGLKRDALPRLEPIDFRWPFRKIDPEVVTGLVGTAAANVENGLLATLATAGIEPRRSPQAAAVSRKRQTAA